MENEVRNAVMLRGRYSKYSKYQPRNLQPPFGATIAAHWCTGSNDSCSMQLQVMQSWRTVFVRLYPQ